MRRLKTSLIVAAVVAMAGTTIVAGSALAATNASSQDSLVDKLSSKFNLNKDDVQKTFDEFHEEREAEHQHKLSEYLQTKVDDKTITAGQKTLLESKLEEMHQARKNNRDELKDLTPEQRKAKLDEKRDEFKKWAEQNNIPLDKLDLPGPGHGRGRGPHH